MDPIQINDVNVDFLAMEMSPRWACTLIAEHCSDLPWPDWSGPVANIIKVCLKSYSRTALRREFNGWVESGEGWSDDEVKEINRLINW